VNAQIESKKQLNYGDIFHVPSDRLKQLRGVIRSYKQLTETLGTTFQFRLVVDSNVVLGDLLWLTTKRKNIAAKTDLIEVIESETIEVYAPPALFEEVEEKIPLIAKDKGIDVSLLIMQWQEYKTYLKSSEPDIEKVAAIAKGVDPDDAPFIALAQTISAHGVISKDKHIGMMGGAQISITCVTHLRNYSRATAVELNIKVNGVIFAGLSVAAIDGLIQGVRQLSEKLSKAPDWVKLCLLAGVLFVVLHPSARANVANKLNTVLGGIKELTPSVIALISKAKILAEEKRVEAKANLDKAMVELGNK